jgi:leucine dehydrogenase
MWPYKSHEAALTDALRLARGMSYKSAMAGLPLGGGKSVIIGDKSMDTPELRKAFARFVQSLGGRYYAAEDVNTGIEQIKWMMTESDYIFGLPGGSGDPSPVTARGVFEGLRATVAHQTGSNSLTGLRVAVQGLGSVGYDLCRYLHEAGADLVVTDIHQGVIDRAVDEFNAEAVAPDAIYEQNVDVFAPCALGGVLNDTTIPQLKATMIAGAANNQLKDERHGAVLHEMGILYAPDYIVNAGGIINAGQDIFADGYHRESVMEQVRHLYHATLEVFERSEQENRPPSDVADDLARERIARGMEIAPMNPTV